MRLAIGMKLLFNFVTLLFGEPFCAFDVLDDFFLQKPAKAAGFHLMLNRRVSVIKLLGKLSTVDRLYK